MGETNDMTFDLFNENFQATFSDSNDPDANFFRDLNFESKYFSFIEAKLFFAVLSRITFQS